MAKTTAMRLIEMMVLKEHIDSVICYLGKLKNFQFQNEIDREGPAADEMHMNPDAELFKRLEEARVALGIEAPVSYPDDINLPSDKDFEDASKLIASVEELHDREIEKQNSLKRVTEAYEEALSFSNLQVSYSELENLSFMTMRIGKIDPACFDGLKFDAGRSAVIVQLGDDKSRIMAACPKKNRFNLDKVLKSYGFVEMEIPKDFKGIPEDMLVNLLNSRTALEQELASISEERKNYSETHAAQLQHLLLVYSLGSQVRTVESRLESTQLVYCIRGWLPSSLIQQVTKDIEELTEDKTGIREYKPEEVPSVLSGHEKVPVQLKHGKLVGAFERMIFSYGSPLYGTLDPTPFVALFFTLLFGIMFGDAGQGLVFLLMGILMAAKVLKVGGWEKFAPVFIVIGISSMIMGVLTGEFFGTEEMFVPFARWVTGLFGKPRDVILHMMPSSDASSIKRMFLFFGFSVGVGFVINSAGIVINIINKFMLRKQGEAIFGKTGITGAVFFWYVVYAALKVAFFNGNFEVYDWIIIGTSLALTGFSEPLARAVDKEYPACENGIGSAVIGAIVEILETVSSTLSNSVSFLRVGAFALAHAVLGFIIGTMSQMGGPAVKILVLVVGNGIVIVLEGIIVTIQTLRLQYYEFFSKFFKETGKEFVPFQFEYKSK